MSAIFLYVCGLLFLFDASVVSGKFSFGNTHTITVIGFLRVPRNSNTCLTRPSDVARR